MVTICSSVKHLVEVLLFVAGDVITLGELCAVTDLSEDKLRLALRELQLEYEKNEKGLQICEIAGGFQICTHPEYASYIERLIGEREKNVLSQAALETLAIIAYRQPITKQEIEAVRGVRVDAVINTLLGKDLIAETGRKVGLGRPILYGTTRNFY